MTNEILPEIPENWSWIKLGDLCKKPQYGWTTKAVKEGKLKILRTTDITSGKIDWKTVPYCQKEPVDIEKYLLYEGDIVISRAGSVGYSYLIEKPENSIFASYLIRFKTNINQKYLAYFLRSPYYWRAISEKKLGIAIPNVNATKLKDIYVSVAPKQYQERIVSKIEELFTKLDAGVTSLKQTKEQLARYRQAVLKAAFEGKLTEKWRYNQKILDNYNISKKNSQEYIESATDLLKRILKEKRKIWEKSFLLKQKEKGIAPKDDLWKNNYKEIDNTDSNDLPILPKSWLWVKFNQISKSINSGSTPRKNQGNYVNKNNGIPFIKVQNIYFDGTIRLDEKTVFISKDIHMGSNSRSKCSTGDILLNIVGPPLGKIGIIGNDIEIGNTNQAIVVVKLFDQFVNNHFLLFELYSPVIYNKIIIGKGVRQENIRVSEIRNLDLILVPYKEQFEIFKMITKTFSTINYLSNLINDQLELTQKLKQSVLRKAFTGNLLKSRKEIELGNFRNEKKQSRLEDFD